MDTALVHFFAYLHKDMKTRVRTSAYGEVSGDIVVAHQGRQGCVLAPLFLILYVNELYPFLTITPGVTKIKGRLLPTLLYADDAVLMAPMPKALHLLVHAFVDFMAALDLQIN